MKILLISEDRFLTKSLKDRLSENNFFVDIAKTGMDVLRKLILQKYQVVLSGIQIPGLNGLQLCSLIREKHYAIPFIFITAISDLKTKIRAFQIGADDYLVHPFHFDELALRLRSLLHRRHGKIENVLNVGDITIDCNSREVYRDSQKIPLRNREYQLFEFLVRHKNTVFTRSSLLEYIWGMQCNLMTTNTVDVHVNNLRQKLGPPKQRLIQTIHGVGYKVAPF